MNIHGVEILGEDDRVVINARSNGTFEPDSFAVWLSAIRRGEVAIDVGAYSGLYAIAAAKAGAIAVAYEPNPTMFKRLIKNIERNGAQVDARNCAASDIDGQSDFWMTHDITSAGRFAHRKNGSCIKVRTEVIREHRKVCAIKIDVEGAEILVLRGLMPVLMRDRPVVIAEALKDKDRHELAAHMLWHGYSFEIMDKRNMIFRWAP